MWNLAIPIWELVLRSAVVYAFLIGLLRLTGKRQIGQLAPFDLVLLLVLSNAVQNSMNGGDNSLLGGLVSAATTGFRCWTVSGPAIVSWSVPTSSSTLKATFAPPCKDLPTASTASGASMTTR